MAILDFLKKKITTHPLRPSEERAPKTKKIKEEKKTLESEAKKPKEEIKSEIPKPKVKIPGTGYLILKSPQITEKATDLVKNNQYVFKVHSSANKIEIKKAIENLYGVEVISVKVIKVPKRQRRLGRTIGWRKGYKKAIIKIKEGQKIEIMPR